MRVTQFLKMLLCASALACNYTTSIEDLIRGTGEAGGLLFTLGFVDQTENGFALTVEIHNPGTVARTYKLRECTGGALLYSAEPAADVAPAWRGYDWSICPGVGSVETTIQPGERRTTSVFGAYGSGAQRRPPPGRYYPAVHIGLSIPNRDVFLAVLNTEVVIPPLQ